jgi:hypothetical protein
MTAQDPAPPPPVIGKSFNAAPVSGEVFIKLPGGPASDRASDTTGPGFIPLTEARQLPTGTKVDARRGKMRLIAALPQKHKTENGIFGSALFGVTQPGRGADKGVATLALLEGLFPGAPSYANCHGTSHRVLQTLHSSDRGHFRSSGHYASATVRGTVWDTTDRCDGTLIVVKRGAVIVRDFVHHKTVVLHAHQRYLAKAPKKH